MVDIVPRFKWGFRISRLANRVWLRSDVTVSLGSREYQHVDVRPRDAFNDFIIGGERPQPLDF